MLTIQQTFIVDIYGPLVVPECKKAYTIRDGRLEKELTKDEISKATSFLST